MCLSLYICLIISMLNRRTSKHLSTSSAEAWVRPTLFVHSLPEVLKCPICQALLSDAVISTRCGHTFCFKCVCPTPRNSVNFPSPHQASSIIPTLPLSSTGLCPLDQVLFQSADLIPNRAIREQVSSLRIHCCHGVKRQDTTDAADSEEFMVDVEGCGEEIELGKRDLHEGECSFAQATCPNSVQCGLYRKRDMELHLKSCSYTSCCYAPFGCNFVGCPSAVDTHEGVCVNRSETGIACVKELKEMKTNQNDLSSRVEELARLVKDLQTSFCSQLEQQNRQLVCLSVRVDAIETQLGSFLYGNISNRRNSSIPLDNEESKQPGGDACDNNPKNGAWLMPFTLKCVGTFQGHKGNLTSLVSSQGYLISGATDGQIKLWNATDPTRGCYKTTEAHETAISALAVEGAILYSSGRDLSLCAWQLPGMELLCRKEAAHCEIVSAMMVLGAILVTAVSDSLRMWQLESGKLVQVKTIPDLPHKVRALTYDRRRALLYSGAHNTIHVWQGENPFPLRNKIESMGFSSIYSLATTAQFLVVGTYNQNIQVLDIDTYQHYRTLTGHIGTVTCLLTTPQGYGQFIFSGSQDTTVQLWNLDNMLPVQSFQRHETPVTGLALYNDWFFSASEEKEIKVFKRLKS